MLLLTLFLSQSVMPMVLQLVTTNGTDGLLVWGGQFETNATTSCIPTGAATATRAQDVMEITGDDFTSWWNDPQEL